MDDVMPWVGRDGEAVRYTIHNPKTGWPPIIDRAFLSPLERLRAYRYSLEAYLDQLGDA